MRRMKNYKEEIVTIPQEIGSVLCEGLTFKDGNLSGVGKININCYFLGNISTNDLVVVDEAASILGNIEAHSIIVKGNIKGDLEIVDSAQLRSGGVVNGNITCATLEVSAGAAFSGECNMTASKKERNILQNMSQKTESESSRVLPLHQQAKSDEE